MRRLVALATVPLLVLLGACNGGSKSGSNSSPSASATSASPSASPSPATAAQLDAALLTAADLGAGWSATAPEDPDDDDSPSPAASGTCSLDSVGEQGVELDRTVELQNEESGTFVNHEVEAYAAGQATMSMQRARELFTRCTSFAEPDEDGGTLTLTVSPYPGAPSLGDESLAYKLSATVEGQTLTGAMIAVRRGDYMAALMGLSATQNPEQYLNAAAQKAAEKLPAA